jgi:hypothetical protein
MIRSCPVKAIAVIKIGTRTIRPFILVKSCLVIFLDILAPCRGAIFVAPDT